MKIGIQLYSLREEIEKLGLEKVLEEISRAGFSGVEFAGFYGKSCEELKELLAKYRLEAMGAHIVPEELAANADYVSGLGMPTVAVPWLDEQARGAAALTERMRGFVREAGKLGAMPMYHNHDFEFAGGGDLLLRLAEEVPGLYFETDIYWLKAVGKPVEAYLEKLGERVGALHVKELDAAGTSAPNPVVGQGVAECAAALRFGKRRGLSWAVLEAEHFGMDPMRYIAESCEFMRKIIN